MSRLSRREVSSGTCGCQKVVAHHAVAELGDPGGPAPADGAGELDPADGELEGLPKRVVEGQELPDAALASLLGSTAGDLDPGQLQLLLSVVEGRGVGEEEPGPEHTRRALDQREAVGTVVGAKMSDAVLLRHQLQANDVDGEPHRVLQVGRAGTRRRCPRV
jgi:hypothetical protein